MSRNSAPAAPSPRPTAAATTAAPAASAAPPTAAPAAPAATADPSHLLEAGCAMLLIEQMERGEADVSHLLIAKSEAMPGPVVVRLPDISGRRRGCGCVSHQGKPQSGGTQHRRGSGFGRAVFSCSLLHPSHDRFLDTSLGSSRGSGHARTAYECKSVQAVPIREKAAQDEPVIGTIGRPWPRTRHASADQSSGIGTPRQQTQIISATSDDQGQRG
jgi:hypothetical protein